MWSDTQRLPPVVLNELLGDGVNGELERPAGIVTLFHRKISERQQQGEFVRCDKLALVEQSLEIHQEFDLLVRRRLHPVLSLCLIPVRRVIRDDPTDTATRIGYVPFPEG